MGLGGGAARRGRDVRRAPGLWRQRLVEVERAIAAPRPAAPRRSRRRSRGGARRARVVPADLWRRSRRRATRGRRRARRGARRRRAARGRHRSRPRDRRTPRRAPTARSGATSAIRSPGARRRPRRRKVLDLGGGVEGATREERRPRCAHGSAPRRSSSARDTPAWAASPSFRTTMPPSHAHCRALRQGPAPRRGLEPGARTRRRSGGARAARTWTSSRALPAAPGRSDLARGPVDPGGELAGGYPPPDARHP